MTKMVWKMGLREETYQIHSDSCSKMHDQITPAEEVP